MDKIKIIALISILICLLIVIPTGFATDSNLVITYGETTNANDNYKSVVDAFFKSQANVDLNNVESKVITADQVNQVSSGITGKSYYGNTIDKTIQLDENGNGLAKVEIGTYTITEVAKDGYTTYYGEDATASTTPPEVTVDYNKTTIQKLYNEHTGVGYVRVEKTLEGVSNPQTVVDKGIEFVVVGQNVAGGRVESKIKIDKIDPELTEQIQKEFNYWYPLNWRLSAKDLVGNHLSFHMFHHAAIFPKEYWPKGITVFGMGLLEGQKMSSSKGNVILLSEAIDKYGADTVRLFLMSSAEPWQDFDWREKEVNGIQRRLELIQEFPKKVESLIGEPLKLSLENEIPTVEKPINKWIISQINQKIGEATEALEGFQTRKALQAGLFLFRKDVDYYLNRITSIEQEEKETLTYIVNTWIRLLSPFVPYTTEEIWDKYNDDDIFMSSIAWPEKDDSVIDANIEKSEEIIQDLAKDIKEIIKITKANPETVHLYTAPDWKYKVYDIAQEVGKPNIGEIIGRAMKANLHDNKKELSKFATKAGKSFNKINYVGKIDEVSIIEDAKDYLESEINAKIEVYDEPFKGHPVAKLIREDLPNSFRILIDNPKKYEIKGSSGLGRWAIVPWISFLNKEITSTPQDGYYVVLLFKEDMSGFNLSLNFGSAYFIQKYGKKNLQKCIDISVK